jgi:hypothetical protein
MYWIDFVGSFTIRPVTAQGLAAGMARIRITDLILRARRFFLVDSALLWAAMLPTPPIDLMPSAHSLPSHLAKMPSSHLGSGVGLMTLRFVHTPQGTAGEQAFGGTSSPGSYVYVIRTPLALTSGPQTDFLAP